jgi:hypothetical protein
MKFFTRVSLLVATPLVLAAQSPDAKALLKLEDDWATAVVKRDKVTFERILAPKFVYTEDDRFISRADLLKDIVSGTDTVKTALNEKLEVHLFGPSTGVVTGWLVLIGRGKEGAFNRRFRFTDTWVKTKGTWQIVAAQDYLVPKK